jgi:hypothetical protein
MKRIDINRKYRSVAVFCAIHGGKNDGRAHIPWTLLREKFGISWETYTNELRSKGMLFAGNDYVYLRPAWAAMTQAERMEQIKRMYPYPYQEQ